MINADYNIADNLPESLNRENLEQVAKLIDAQMHELNMLSELVSIYPRIDELSSRLVDALAIQFHVDFYDTTLPLDKRRALVKNSMRWHMRKGTKGVVQELIQTIWDSGIVREWFEYEGEPYHFRVEVLEAPIVDPTRLAEIGKAISTVKNARSWLDGINFLRRENAVQYYGGAPQIHRRYAVAQILYANTDAVHYYGGVTASHKSYGIMQAAAVNDATDTATIYDAGATVIHKRYRV